MGRFLIIIWHSYSLDNTAVEITKELLKNSHHKSSHGLNRKEASDILGITMDTLRNWEMNGLLKVKRKGNGYRVYLDEDIRKLKIIRSLKCANYSLSAILRMMNDLDKNSRSDIGTVLNTPNHDEDIISVCDRLIVSLVTAKDNATSIKSMLLEMKIKYSNPPI